MRRRPLHPAALTCLVSLVAFACQSSAPAPEASASPPTAEATTPAAPTGKSEASEEAPTPPPPPSPVATLEAYLTLLDACEDAPPPKLNVDLMNELQANEAGRAELRALMERVIAAKRKCAQVEAESQKVEAPAG